MEKIVIAAASFYNQKYYFNPDFNELPPELRSQIREEIVLAAQESKGVFSVGFYTGGEMFLETGGAPEDLNYDEIEGKLQVRKLEQTLGESVRKIMLWHHIKNNGGV